MVEGCNFVRSANSSGVKTVSPIALDASRAFITSIHQGFAGFPIVRRGADVVQNSASTAHKDSIEPITEYGVSACGKSSLR
jgi:hypothetical protein